MEKAKVLHGQSMLDMAVQHTGSMEGAFALSRANGVSLTEDLPLGALLVLPEASDKRTAVVFGNLIHKPATALTDYVDDQQGGIFDDTFDESFE